MTTQQENPEFWRAYAIRSIHFSELKETDKAARIKLRNMLVPYDIEKFDVEPGELTI